MSLDHHWLKRPGISPDSAPSNNRTALSVASSPGPAHPSFSNVRINIGPAQKQGDFSRVPLGRPHTETQLFISLHSTPYLKYTSPFPSTKIPLSETICDAKQIEQGTKTNSFLQNFWAVLRHRLHTPPPRRWCTQNTGHRLPRPYFINLSTVCIVWGTLRR